MVLVQTHLRQLGKLLGSCCGIDGSGDAGMPGQHPIDIAIHHSLRFAVGKTGDGCCCISAHSRQSEQFVIAEREVTVGNCLSGSLVKIACPTVIAQPLPQAHDFIFGCLCQMPDRGVVLGEARIVVASLFHPGLLQDNLRQPYQVSILGVTPGQIAPVLPVPFLDACSKGKVIGQSVLGVCGCLSVHPQYVLLVYFQRLMMMLGLTRR